MSVLEDAIRTLRPPRGDRFGPLPPLLVLMTVVTGLVDAVSYVMLGHVFVANMTGNVVFLGFAISGAPGLSIVSSLLALAAFLVGATAGGRIGHRLGDRRGQLLRTTVAIELALLCVAIVIAAIAGDGIGRDARDLLIVVLALAMGVQNAAARGLAVPDLTTTVLTMTLTGIAADSKLAGGAGARVGRRGIAVLAMLLGALVGTLLARQVTLSVPLALAAGLLAVVGVVAERGDRTAAWQTA